MLNLSQIILQVGEKLREIATRQGHVPFWRGDLRKSHIVTPDGANACVVSANTPYARAVHDGRPAITIRPRNKKALAWPGAAHPVGAVRQPARAGRPWLRDAIPMLADEGLDWLRPEIGEAAADELLRDLRNLPGVTVRRR